MVSGSGRPTSTRTCRFPKSSRRSNAAARCSCKGESARLLLVPLLALSLDVELLLLAPEIRLSLPLELVPVDLQGVVDGDRVALELPHGGERQLPVLEFRVLELFVLLVRPVHGPDERVPLLLDRQGGRPLLPADLVLA